MRQFNPNIFYSNIDFLCGVKGMTVADLSRRLEIKGTSLYVAKTQKSVPSLSRVIEIADALGVKIDDLLFTDYKELQEAIDKAKKQIAEMEALLPEREDL